VLALILMFYYFEKIVEHQNRANIIFGAREYYQTTCKKTIKKTGATKTVAPVSSKPSLYLIIYCFIFHGSISNEAMEQ